MRSVASAIMATLMAALAISPLASGQMTGLVGNLAGVATSGGSLAQTLSDGVTQYAVGFVGAPPVSPGDEFHGSTVLGVNKVINFAAVLVHDPATFAVGVATDHRISYFEPDLPLIHADLVPNDPRYANQYDLKPTTTDAQTAWDKTLGSTSVKVCITDSGADTTHPDFVGATFYYWKDEVNGRTTAYDDYGHGTHVAGTIGAVINNGVGVAGAAQVSLGNVKVLDATGSRTFTQVANGVTDCQTLGANIINLSLGCNGGIGSGCDSTTLHNAIISAYNAGILVVASAGNAGPCTNCIGLPAAYPEAVAITCSNAQNAFCWYSSQGPQAFVMAPGQEIISLKAANTVLTGCTDVYTYYRTCNGTSMSAPHVSAEAALIKSYNPSWDRAALKLQIAATAVPQPGISTDQQGNGLINYGNAVVHHYAIGPIHVSIVGNPPGGASVNIYNPAGSNIYSATTDANGNVPGTGPVLNPGTYTLIATYSTCNGDTGAIYRYSGTYTLPPSVAPTVQPTWFHTCPTVPPP